MTTKPRFKACMLAVALTMLPWSAEAAGLGRLNVLSGLGQPFKGEIELVSVQAAEAESLKVALAPVEAYAAAHLSYPASSMGLRLVLDKRSNGQYVVSVSSAQAIDEPVFNVLVELSWLGGRVRREYTALIDPVGYSATPGGATIAPLSSPAQAAVAPAVLPGKRMAGAISPPKATRSARQGKAASAVASQQAEKGENYTVKSGDTLSRIAGQVKPEGVSLEQVLVGLYQSNPDAFSGNMNRLKRGRILHIPSSDELGKVDQAQAAKEIKVQSADWQKYRRHLAEATAKTAAAEGSAQRGGGRISAKVEDKGGAAEDKSKDVLKLSRGASAAAGRAANVRALEEESAARKKALDEANQRVAELQKNIQKMEAEAAVKSQQGAELQRKAEEAKASAPAVTASAPAVAPIASAAAFQSASVPAVASKASAVQPRPKVTPQPVQEPGILDMLAENAVAIGGGLLAVALGVGGLLWARKRRRPNVFENSLITSGDLKPNTVLGRTGGGVISTQAENSFLTDFSRQGLGTIDTDEVDPIAEADVYMAYGRDAQAEEILKDALVKDPQRQEIRLKLLDIYAARKDKVSFQEVAADVFAATGGHGQYWDHVAEQGRGIDPDNPLYVSKEGSSGAALAAAGVAGVAVAAAAVAYAATREEPAQQEPVLPVQAPEAEPQDLGELDFDFELPVSQKVSATPVEPMAEPLVAAATEQEENLFAQQAESGFDLDLELPQALAAQPEPEPEEDNLMELDLPIDFGLPTEPVVEAQQDIAAFEIEEEVAPELSKPATPDFSMPDIDLDLELDVVPEAPAAEDKAEEAALASFSADLAEAETIALEPVAELTVPQAGLQTEEKIDLDFGFEPPAVAEVVAEPVTVEPIDIDREISAGDAGALDFVGDDPVQTKIELARAYIDMGDVEGAREILQEAEQEGNPTQQELARNLLAAL